MVKKLIDFVLFFVNAIKDMVAALTGKTKPATEDESNVSQ